MKELEDRRCPTRPDEPYSAYCRVCWLSVYTMWLDEPYHHGACPEGATSPQRCSQACAAAKMRAELVAAGVIKP